MFLVPWLLLQLCFGHSFYKTDFLCYLIHLQFLTKKLHQEFSGLGFPGGAVVENLPANAGNTGSSPGLGRSHMPRSN